MEGLFDERGFKSRVPDQTLLKCDSVTLRRPTVCYPLPPLTPLEDTRDFPSSTVSRGPTTTGPTVEEVKKFST